MKKTFSCRQIAAGKVRGEVLTCTDQILFTTLTRRPAS